MTNPWTDIQNADLIVIMGGNAAEAHPCGFKWVTEAKANRGAKLIVVDPRFTRSASVSDFYAPIRQGTDIAFLMGVINYCIQNDKVQWEYVKAFRALTHLTVALRDLPIPVIGRVEKGAQILDLRCLEGEAEFTPNLAHLDIGDDRGGS
jgi:anaerobic selenocysteine-containing dehydrogenase